MCYFLVGLLLLTGCIETTSSIQSDPTQLATRQIEVRRLEVPFDVAYRAATQAMFSLGYGIEHSDKVSGILTGFRMIGVRAAKEAKKKQESLAFWWGPVIAKALAPVEEANRLLVTMYLQAAGEKRTEIRFTMQVDGEPAWDSVVIDKLWVTTEREAMIEEGPGPASVAKTNTTPQAPSSASQTASPETKKAKTTQATTPPPQKVIYVKNPAITLWDRSGTQSLRIVTLPKGTKLTVLGQEDKWCHVKTEDGREGWVASELTSPQP